MLVRLLQCVFLLASTVAFAPRTARSRILRNPSVASYWPPANWKQSYGETRDKSEGLPTPDVIEKKSAETRDKGEGLPAPDIADIKLGEVKVAAASFWPAENWKSASKGAQERALSEHAKIIEFAKKADLSKPSPSIQDPFLYRPIFRFDATHRSESLARWERVDDAIMGGVSTSSLVGDSSNVEAIRFRGILREEGGGFCGQRTKLFKKPMNLTAFTGLYVKCRGDDNADRRIYKVNVRTK